MAPGSGLVSVPCSWTQGVRSDGALHGDGLWPAEQIISVTEDGPARRQPQPWPTGIIHGNTVQLAGHGDQVAMRE